MAWRIRIPKGPEGSWYPINTRLLDITSPPPTTQALVLGLPYRDPGDTPKDRAVAYESGGPEDYEIELQPRLIPMEPVVLPDNTCIDLDGSKIPEAWRPWAAGVAQSSGNSQYSQYIDIVYSPRGNLLGDLASGGLIHFCVCDAQDAKNLKEQYINSLDPDPATALQKFNRELRLTGGTFVPADVIKASVASWIAALDPNGEGYPVRDRRVVSVFTKLAAVSIHPVNALDSENNGGRQRICRRPLLLLRSRRGGQMSRLAVQRFPIVAFRSAKRSPAIISRNIIQLRSPRWRHPHRSAHVAHDHEHRHLLRDGALPNLSASFRAVHTAHQCRHSQIQHRSPHSPAASSDL
jgi:hypothetical protein